MVRKAKEAKQNDDPLAMLQTASNYVERAGRGIAHARLRGDCLNDPTINPLVTIPASNIVSEGRALLRDLELAPERPAVWEALTKGLKGLKDRSDAMNDVLHEEGIAESVKQVDPPLRTDEGKRLADTEVK